MTDKGIQIEELTQEIEFAKKGLWNAENLKKEDYSWHSRGIAEHLFSIGYRKIPEGSVVLSGEQCVEIVQDNYNIGYERGSKETAKEIASKVKECKEIKELVEFGYIVSYVYLCKAIDEIAKQYGVEL